MNEQDERVCWKCYDGNSHLVVILDIINELKKKKISSNFNNLLERINVGDEVPEISEDLLKEVLNFAEENGFIISHTYKGNISYKVNDKLKGEYCSCGEPLSSKLAISSPGFNFSDHVDMPSFKTLVDDVKMLKESFFSLRISSEIKSLTEENKLLTSKLQSKDEYINSLLHFISFNAKNPQNVQTADYINKVTPNQLSMPSDKYFNDEHDSIHEQNSFHNHAETQWQVQKKAIITTKPRT